MNQYLYKTVFWIGLLTIIITDDIAASTVPGDTIPPVIVTPASNASSQCAGSSIFPNLLDWYETAGGLTATDNEPGTIKYISNLTYQDVEDLFILSDDCGDTRSVSVDFFAVDSCGNQSLPSNAKYASVDTRGPTITRGATASPNFCSPNINETLKAWVVDHGGSEAIDNCSQTVVWARFAYSDDLGNSGNGRIGIDTIPIPDAVCSWRATVSFIAIDECGNQSVSTSSFSIFDQQDPSFSSLPGDTTVNCSDLPLTISMTGIDNCTVSPVISVEDVSDRTGSNQDCSFYNFNTIRTFTVTDACGNTATHTQVVTVEDTEPPVFAIIDTVSIDCQDLNNPNASFLPSNVQDDCSSVMTTFTDSIVGEGCTYQILRKYSFADICGNVAEANQIINVFDDTPPVLSTTFADYIVFCDVPRINSFEIFLNDLENLVPTDDCSEVFSFVAVPGSYDLNDPNTFPGLHPGGLDSLGCGGAPEGFLVYEEVDFVYYDNCTNASKLNSIYGIRDTLAPIITSCGQDLTVNVDTGTCMAQIMLPEINIEDDCIDFDTIVTRSVSLRVVSGDPGNPDLPVFFPNAVLGPYNADFLEVTGNGTLTISINEADMDEENEFFTIFSETGDSLARSPMTSAQCASTEISIEIDEADINRWIVDGEIRIFFLQNGLNEINDICGNTSIDVSLTFANNSVLNIKRRTLIDGVYTPNNQSIFVSSGVHIITEIVSDCANNEDSCSYTVTVLDNESPVITCPSPIIINQNSESCALDVTFPFDYFVKDNCALNIQYSQQAPLSASASFLNFSQLTSDDPFEAESIVHTFSNVFSIHHSNEPASLTIEVLADINDGGEILEIRGEDGSSIGFLGNTQLVSCELYRQTYSISKEQINAWSQDGTINISYIVLGSEDGINPCSNITSDGSDGKSFIRSTLSYSDASVTFEISGNTSLPLTDFSETSDSLSLPLNAGANIFTLYASDAADNKDTCSVTLIVRDAIAPIARCKQAVALLDPSGVNPYLLQPSELEDGSTDNCGIDSMSVFPQEITCANLDQEIPVFLYVFDASGNSDTCSTRLLIRTPILEPFFTIDVCNQDTLKLFANAPSTSIPNAYRYKWTGPFFSSLISDPIIPNVSGINNGTYNVVVTGLDGCVSEGTVEVNVSEVAVPVITTAEEALCNGENVLLTTNGLSGNTNYMWYEGTFPNGLLLETTQSPSLLLTPLEGEHFYYMIIEKGGCESNASAAKRVVVVDDPIAKVFQEFITVCEGEPIVFGAESSGGSVAYNWRGPNLFTSGKQFPDTIFNASVSNSGTYNLVVSVGSCVSDTARLLVTVFDKPITPIIVSGDIFCEGSSIGLSVNNIPNADLYTWYKDEVERSTTSSNTLTLNNADETLSGDWTVKVLEGLCESNFSAPKSISIESELLISANNNGPGCEGDSITLSTSFVPGANYSWTGPDGFTSNLQNPKIKAIAGQYNITITTPTGCDGDASTSVSVILPPEITALSSNALECMDGNTDITFFPSVFPAGAYTFEWTGPFGFTADSLNPKVEDATEINNGVYTVVAISGNCKSQPKSLTIDITTTPSPPTIEGNDKYCVGDTLKLSVSNSPIANQYAWGTPQGQRFTAVPILTIVDIEEEDQGNYSVSVILGNCRSQASQPINVIIGTIPFQPVIASNSPLCPGDTLRLQSTLINGVEYNWSGPSGFSSNINAPIIPQVSEAIEGNYQLVLNANGCTSESNIIQVDIFEQTSSPTLDDNTFILCESNTADGLEICIPEENVSEGKTFMIYNSKNDQLILESTAVCNRIVDLSIFDVGVNSIYFRAVKDNCISDKSLDITIEIISVPIIDAELEQDIFLTCDDSPIQLTSIFGPPEVNVTWRSLDNNILSNVQGVSTTVSNLGVGINRIMFSYTDNNCGIFSSDTAIITISDQPSASPDTYTIQEYDPILLEVFDNDFITPSTVVNINSQPVFGTVELREDGILYTPDPRFVGATTFSYEVCAPECNVPCQTVQVTIQIGNATLCEAPTIFTPNGDGYNDSFVIRCLSSGIYNGNTLNVYNQWGSAVFEAENYSSSWEGTYNGDPLPVGTYFYVLDLNDGSEPIIGFLILER